MQQTLVVEIIGTMVNCLDPTADENFSVFDVTISGNRLLKVEKPKCTETLFVRFHAQSLGKLLEKFYKQFEIIIYTILPRQFMN